MDKEKIWLSSPHMGGEEREFVSQAFDTNWIAPLGPHVNGFEKDIQDFNGIANAAALSSGTAAIHLSLILNNIGPGDLVFVQSFTFSATINPIIYQGATPVFIDSEPGTWNMSPEHLEKAIQSALDGTLSPFGVNTEGNRSGGAQRAGKDSSQLPPSNSSTPNTQYSTPNTQNPKPNTHYPIPTTQDPKPNTQYPIPTTQDPLTPKAIIPVHLYGMPANMDAIMEVARKYDLPVIEDAAESLGSKYGNSYTGAIGSMGIYSFNGNKIITTSGGGALVSRDEELIARARFLATQARDDAPHYQHSRVGYNYRMSNVLAGVGRGQMKVLSERVAQRRANFERYRSYFRDWNNKGFDIRFQIEPQGSFSNRWLTAILVDPETNHGLTREKIRLGMEEENIECRPLWKPMHLQPVFKGYPFVGDGTSEDLFEIGLCLPSGSSLTEKDFDRIFKALDNCFKSVSISD